METGAGLKKVVPLGEGSSRVDMGLPGFDSEIELRGFRFLRISMGNPHVVACLGSEEEVEALDLREIGPPVENDSLFPETTNVEFVHVRGKHEVRMRIWERGAEETLASGSGSCAAAVATMRRGFVESPVRVAMDGGMVEIEWAGDREPVYITGPAEYICGGDLLL